MTIDITLPRGWAELTDKQARWIFKRMARQKNLSKMNLLLSMLFKLSGIKYLGVMEGNTHSIIYKDRALLISTDELTAAARNLEWALRPSPLPWRPNFRLCRCANVSLWDLSFKKWLDLENCYSQFLESGNHMAAKTMAKIMLRKRVFLSEWEITACIYWFISVKSAIQRKFKYLYSSTAHADDDVMGVSKRVDTDESMNAQLRALTKGDITKERTVLKLPMYRAIIELNEQAREAQEIAQLTKQK